MNDQTFVRRSNDCTISTTMHLRPPTRSYVSCLKPSISFLQDPSSSRDVRNRGHCYLIHCFGKCGWYLVFQTGTGGTTFSKPKTVFVLLYYQSFRKQALFVLYVWHLFVRYWFCSRIVRLTFLSKLYAHKNYWESTFLRSRAGCFVISPPQSKMSLFCYSVEHWSSPG